MLQPRTKYGCCEIKISGQSPPCTAKIFDIQNIIVLPQCFAAWSSLLQKFKFHQQQEHPC